METEEPQKDKRKRKKPDLARKVTYLVDGELCEMSRVWQQLFINHLPQFEAFDPGLNNTFALNWLAQIEALDTHETDETFVDGLEMITKAVKDLTHSALVQLDGFEYFVKRAFVNDARILLEFGFDYLRKPTIIGSSARFTIGGFVFVKLLNDYQPELTAAGMPPALITDFETIIGKLGEAEVQQEYTKRLRIRSTTARIKGFNTLYATHRQVAKAAAIVFINRPDIAKQFEH